MDYTEVKKFIPNQGRVLVKPLNSDKSRGGIILPPTSTKEFPKRGIVVAAGKFADNENAEQYQVGNLIMYSSYSGTEVSIDGVDYLLMRYGDIWGHLPGGEDII